MSIGFDVFDCLQGPKLGHLLVVVCMGDHISKINDSPIVCDHF